ncbi:MAG: nucleoside triphosphate pyrophosphohydrolase [Bacteroidales bacterium]|nr:nucleoside triphosphate pyrophosphohydrolase [Lentimicrobiaceae bacterium]MDD5694527.1 nucleoside triphosphate pyrophosphohydrolase [Bacteroidales bacterium]
MDSTLKAFERLLVIMDDLRGGCPWDREQTFESLRHLTIEETYELSDAILESNMDEIRDELGDLMLHIVFYARIGSERGAFTMQDILEHISQKLIIRHPHIYGDVKVSNARDVKDNWEKIKLREGRNSVLEGVPGSLPALVKAYRIQEKARGVGFDWDHIDQVWEKVLEEKEELKTEIVNDSNREILEDEFGDLLFALVNYARFIRINPEDALERSNKKFIRRFQLLEELVRKDGRNLSGMTLSEMDVYWERAKRTANGE